MEGLVIMSNAFSVSEDDSKQTLSTNMTFHADTVSANKIFNIDTVSTNKVFHVLNLQINSSSNFFLLFSKEVHTFSLGVVQSYVSG